MKKSKIGIWNITKNLILVLVIFLFILTILSAIGWPKGFRVFTVMSGSIDPTIPQGSLIFVMPSDTYNNQDIVTFENTDNTSNIEIITHRIIDVNSDETGQSIFTTKGESNNAQDMTPLYMHQIIGRKVLSVPVIGYPISFAKTKLGVILLVLIPALVISLFEMNKIREEIAAKKRIPNSDRNITRFNITYTLIVCLLLTGSIGLTYSRFVNSQKIINNSLSTGSWLILTARNPIYIEDIEDFTPKTMNLIEAERIDVFETETTDNSFTN